METKKEKQAGISMAMLIVRSMAFVLTLLAAILLGINKQAKIVPFQVSPSLPPLNVPVQARWHYMSAFVYAFVTDVIASLYGAISLIYLIVAAKRNGKKGLLLILIILDLVMVALLFSGSGAAAAAGLLAYKGNSHVNWKPVCSVFSKFCNQAGASIAASLLGSLAFFLNIVLAAFTLYNNKT